MKTLLLITLTTVLTTYGFSVRAKSTPQSSRSVSATRLAPAKKTMKAFSSERELARYFSAYLFQNSAAIVFLRNDRSQLREVGELISQPEKAIDDQCRASCVDWYGNARPLFLRGRVFALLGYELVEGALVDGRMRESRRINYTPGKQ